MRAARGLLLSTGKGPKSSKCREGEEERKLPEKRVHGKTQRKMFQEDKKQKNLKSTYR